MVNGGNATICVSDMDAAISFYKNVLGMTLQSRYGDHWATLEAGGFTIGLHPKDGKGPEPGTRGSILVGLTVADIEVAREALVAGGEGDVGPVVRGDGGAFVHFCDVDGNALYLWQ